MPGAANVELHGSASVDIKKSKRWPPAGTLQSIMLCMMAAACQGDPKHRQAVLKAKCVLGFRSCCFVWVVTC
jgi:hypothetical protein